MRDTRYIIDWHARALLIAREDHEIANFARRHGMSPDEVREMVQRIGGDREALEREAARLRRH